MSDDKSGQKKTEALADLEPNADPKAGHDPQLNQTTLASAAPTQQILIGLLLPAVQKVRG